MKYCFRDRQGVEYSGDTYRQVVQEMRRYSWAPPGKRAYIQSVRERLTLLGTPLKLDSARSASRFVKALVNEGLLVAVKRG